MTSPVEAVLIVLHRPGESGWEFLAALRAPGARSESYWSLISGGVEPGETPFEAARRELEEETGLTAPLSWDEIPMSLGFQGEEGWVVLYVFSAETPADWEPLLDEEHVDYRWYDAESALGVLFYEEPRAALREVAGRLETAT